MFSSLKKLRIVGLTKTQMSKCYSSSQYKTLSVTVPKPFVMHVELNRPEKLNAMNHAMWVEIGECFNALSGDPDCRVVIISGAGPKLFTAGMDLNHMNEVGSQVAEIEDIARKCNHMWKIIKLYQSSMSAIENCHKPVIAAVHGVCVGGGLNLICAADIRYSTADAFFQSKEVDIGMAPDVGTLQRLPRAVGSASLVNDLLFSGRKLLASEAKECGFISKIFDDKKSMIDGAVEAGVVIASKSPVAVQVMKRNLLFSRNHSVEDGLEHIALMNMAMLQSEDFMKAIMAQSTKGDPPTFSKL